MLFWVFLLQSRTSSFIWLGVEFKLFSEYVLGVLTQNTCTGHLTSVHFWSVWSWNLLFVFRCTHFLASSLLCKQCLVRSSINSIDHITRSQNNLSLIIKKSWRNLEKSHLFFSLALCYGMPYLFAKIWLGVISFIWKALPYTLWILCNEVMKACWVFKSTTTITIPYFQQ